MQTIKYRVGDLMQAAEPCIAHGCNARGVMGRGVALAIRECYPEAYRVYCKAHVEYGLVPGEVVWAVSQGKLIANCITQEHYTGQGDNHVYVSYPALRQCLTAIEQRSRRISAVALPLIGAGLGGGDWGKIREIICDVFTAVQPVVYVRKQEDLPRE